MDTQQREWQRRAREDAERTKVDENDRLHKLAETDKRGHMASVVSDHMDEYFRDYKSKAVSALVSHFNNGAENQVLMVLIAKIAAITVVQTDLVLRVTHGNKARKDLYDSGTKPNDR